MWVIGLTGGIGAGKTLVSQRFETLGIRVVDTDLISREVVEPGTPCLIAIRQRYGNEIIQPNGQLDRRALRAVIFDNDDEKRWLESLLHPAIRQRTREQLQNAESTYVILSSPLLLQSPDKEIVDRVLVVDIPETLQLERASSRDKTDSEQIKKIMATQMPREERLALADDIIDNAKSVEHTYSQVAALHQKYCTLAENGRS